MDLPKTNNESRYFVSYCENLATKSNIPTEKDKWSLKVFAEIFHAHQLEDFAPVVLKTIFAKNWQLFFSSSIKVNETYVMFVTIWKHHFSQKKFFAVRSNLGYI